MAIIARKFFWTKGVGVHEKDLRAFEEALRDAGIHTLNLVKVSSIIPPGCQQVSFEEGIQYMKPGQIAFAVIARSETNEPGQMVTCGIAKAHPKDQTQHGFLSEVEEAIGRTAEDVEQDVTEMAIENLISQWNPKFDGDKVYRKGKKNYSVEGVDFSVDSIVQSAQGAEKNQFTVVITAAVLIYDEE